MENKNLMFAQIKYLLQIGLLLLTYSNFGDFLVNLNLSKTLL